MKEVLKIKPNLIELFRKYMIRKAEEPEVVEGYDDVDFSSAFGAAWFNEEDDDGFLEYYKEKYGKKKHKHSKKHNKGLIDVNMGDYDDLNNGGFDDIFGNDKKIYFYYDYHDKSDYALFKTVYEFNEFCEGMGYYIDDNKIQEMIYSNEFHCCLYPDSEENGLNEVACELSYGELFFEVCREDEY